MADPKGDKLFVNLSAAQTRRRLKGYGHGVRKIHSAGRDRAVIIHTATGQHLAELETKFADVGCSRTEDRWSEPVQEEAADVRPEFDRYDGGPPEAEEAE